MKIADCRLPIADLFWTHESEGLSIGNRQSAIGNRQSEIT